MNHPDNIKQVWFIGIGGIGMSALARYFRMHGLPVAGYDKTPSVITDALQKEGIDLFFTDGPDLISPVFRDSKRTLVVYTPAVENTQRQLRWFMDSGFSVMKRSEVLGLITRGSSAVCVAGTHGKTTISTMATHLFRKSGIGCTAFLGGISKNYDTNFLWDGDSPYVILEADEFDRSFLKLTPSTALISAVDADHLDIYGDKEQVQNAFIEFGKRISEGGFFIVKSGLQVNWELQKDVTLYTYSINGKADFYATDIELKNGVYIFTFVGRDVTIPELVMGIPGLLNVENAVGAIALALINGVTAAEIKAAMPTFSGIARRFEVHIQSNRLVYIDDYAHHPEEIRATINSIRAMYPGFYLTGIFQPHLYSRTKDFADGFAESLSLLDELFLLEIYPAREHPIPGVNASLIGNKVRSIPVRVCSKNELPDLLEVRAPHVFLTMGAGDIDREVPFVKKRLESFVIKK